MAGTDDDRVELTELDVITRYSLAVRSATADRDELIKAMRDDLAWLESGRSRRRSTRTSSAPSEGTAKKTVAKRTTATRSTRGR